VTVDPPLRAAFPVCRTVLRHPLWLGLATALLAGGADRLSKWWILDVFDLPARSPVRLGSVLDLAMVWNRGVSFGLLAGDAAWHRALLAGFAVLVAIVLAVVLVRTRSAWTAIALGLVIGGAVSNAWDRLVYGAVADFLDFHIGGYHWYTFNVADAAITVGAALLIVDGLFRGGGQHR
jgi:signal peptidase II